MSTTVERTKPNIVNGINIDDLMALRVRVEQDATKSKTNWRITTTWLGQTHSRAEVSGFAMGGEEVTRRFSFDIDEPYELGGSNAFPNPQEYLLAALNACMTVGYVAGAAKRGISLYKLEIETKGTLDLRGFFALSDAVPPGYPRLEYVVRIAGDGTAEQFAEIHAEVQATSPNYDNLARAIRMEAKLEVEGK